MRHAVRMHILRTRCRNEKTDSPAARPRYCHFTNATTTSSAVNSAVKTMMQEVADNGMEPELALANLKQTVGAN